LHGVDYEERDEFTWPREMNTGLGSYVIYVWAMWKVTVSMKGHKCGFHMTEP